MSGNSDFDNVALVSEGFIVIVETNQYAGKFERELTAYCTGIVGECEVGRDMSNLFYRDMDISDDEEDAPDPLCADQKSVFYGFMGDRQDDHGVWRPCSIWANPRYGCKHNGSYAVLTDDNYREFNFPAFLGVAIFFEVKPHKQHIDIITERAKKFFAEIYPKSGGTEGVVVERVRLLREVRGIEDLGGDMLIS
jgi:hypothetical protein